MQHAIDAETRGTAVCRVGDLRIVRRGARSVVARAYAESPLRWLMPSNHGTAAWIFGATYGGGLVGGDALRMGVRVESDASALVSTQASTKVYRSHHGTRVETRATVAPGGHLYLLPEPVVCYAGSSYSQAIDVDLAVGAGLVLVDCLTSGRRASGERWLFNRYASRIVVRYDGRLVMHDATLLRPDEGDLPARMGRFDVVCLIAVFGAWFAAGMQAAVTAIRQRPHARRPTLMAGASWTAEAGGVIRIAGQSLEDVTQLVRALLRFVPEALGDDPWSRRW